MPPLLMLLAAVAGKAANDPSTWVGPDDYPKSALRRGTTGTTVFALGVGPDGSPGDCTIVASSGSEALDTATCALVRARARFVPGRDARGKPVGFVYRNRVVWKMPEGGMVAMPVGRQTLTTTMDIDAKGVVESCRVIERPSDMKDEAQNPCLATPSGSRLRAFTSKDGKPVAARITTTQSVLVEPR